MRRLEMMKRATFVKHGTKMVFVFDLSEINFRDAGRVIAYGEDIIRRMPMNQVLTLIRLNDYTDHVILEKKVGEMFLRNKKHFSRCAFTGIPSDGSKEQLKESFAAMAMEYRFCQSADEALDWLTDRIAA